MKKNRIDAMKTVAVLGPGLVLLRAVEWLPWWSFVVPVVALGGLITRRGWQVPCFGVGFGAGFAVWAGAYLYFHARYHGAILSRTGPLSLVLVLAAVGLVGGLLTGLALHGGKSLVLKPEKEHPF